MIDYISLEETMEVVKNGIKSEFTDIDVLDGMVVMLLRYGITSKQIVKLRNKDFNFDTGELIIKDSGLLRKVKLDKYTLSLVKQAKEMDGKIQGTRHFLNILDDHIIRMDASEYKEDDARRSVKRRVYKFGNNKQVRSLTETMLIDSCKVDMLDEIFEKKGYIETPDDFKLVLRKFGLKESGHHRLKMKYMELCGSHGIVKKVQLPKSLRKD